MEILIILLSFSLAALTAITVRNKRIIELSSLIASFVGLVTSVLIAVKVSSAGGSYASFQFFFVDGLSAIVMLIVAFVGFGATVYSIAYLRQETAKNIIGLSNVSKITSRIREYFILLNLFMVSIFLAIVANSPILAWIFIEATTLSTAFLISFYNKPSAMEAAWKYLIVNSVGILLAFLGTLLYFTSFHTGMENGIITWQMLTNNATLLNPMIVKIAFVFILIGYGTKVGFAPMHTWKPDAYSKAPAPIGALFSGALMPAAFMLILKFKIITDSVAGTSFSQTLFIIFGLLSILIAATIIFVARNYKRVLAYSSIENAGIMALGFGFGGLGIFAAILHMIYHSLIKSALFFLSGNILLKYSSAKISNVKGAISVIPITAILFFTGFFIITGAPPFGIFFTKIVIFSAIVKTNLWVAAVGVALTIILFVGFFKHITSMVFGEKPADIKNGEDSVWLILPPLVFMALALYLSFNLPPFLNNLINYVVLHY